MRPSSRKPVRPSCSLLLVAALSAVVCLSAQAQQQPPQPKPKRVWTNEDLETIKGGINVVGKPAEAKPTGKAMPDKPAEEEAAGDVCESDEWTHAVAAVMESQGTKLDSKFWATRLFNNLCSSGIKLEAVSLRITGDYTLDDGTKIHLKAGVLPHNLPQAAELVASANEQRPFIVARKGRPYVLDRVDYVDRAYDGVSQYSISKLYLTNALTGRQMLLEATADNVKEINGTLQIAVSPRQ
jgi:hypothetical protein